VKEKKRLLGVDFGKVRIGLAISDRDRKIASPLATYTRKNAQADEQFFRNLTETEEVGLIVVGLPIHVDGQEGASAQAARKFGQWLEKATKVPVLFYDERYTTVEAESSLWGAGLTHKRRKVRRDRVAAQILLLTFMEAGCPGLP
jgi:putative Holliday junction resolvase